MSPRSEQARESVNAQLRLFSYRGYDRTGKAVDGQLESDSAEAATRALLERGVLVEKLRPASAGLPDLSGLSARFFTPRLRPLELAMLVRQLATLHGSGLPLDDALDLMARQANTPRSARLLSSWRAALLEGWSLGQAMQRGPIQVPDNLIASISVAEETGHLQEVLLRLADELDAGADARQALAKGLVYPAVMMVVGLIVCVVLMVWVVPQVTRVFASNRIELPLLTRMMIGLSDLLVHHGWVLLLVLVAGVVAVRAALNRPSNKLRWDSAKLRLPLVGQWLMSADVADWSRNLSTLLGSGVPMVPALRIAGNSVRNLALRQCFDRVLEDVRTGLSLHVSLRKHDAMLPAFLLHMVGSGEASSELDSMLAKVAGYYDRSLQASTQTALKLLEPALVIAMAGFVLLIVGAVLVPIVQMNHMI